MVINQPFIYSGVKGVADVLLSGYQTAFLVPETSTIRILVQILVVKEALFTIGTNSALKVVAGLVNHETLTRNNLVTGYAADAECLEVVLLAVYVVSSRHELPYHHSLTSQTSEAPLVPDLVHSHYESGVVYVLVAFVALDALRVFLVRPTGLFVRGDEVVVGGETWLEVGGGYGDIGGHVVVPGEYRSVGQTVLTDVLLTVIRYSGARRESLVAVVTFETVFMIGVVEGSDHFSLHILLAHEALGSEHFLIIRRAVVLLSAHVETSALESPRTNFAVKTIHMKMSVLYLQHFSGTRLMAFVTANSSLAFLVGVLLSVFLFI